MTASNGPLPQSWIEVSLGEIADVVRGVTYKKEEASLQPSEGLLPLVRATNIDLELRLDRELVYVPSRRVSQHQQLRENDIVVATSSGSVSVVGKSARLTQPFNGTFGAFCCVLRPRKDVVHPKYLAHFVSSRRVREAWSSAARGTNINNLKLGDVQGTTVPLAPASEQRRIVAAIEEQFSRIDAGVASVERARLALAQVQRAALEAATAGAPEVTLDDLLSEPLANGRSVPTALAGYPVLRLTCLQRGRVDLSERKVGGWTEADAAPHRVAYGDFLVARGNGSLALVGRGGLVEDEPDGVAYPDTLIRIRVNDERCHRRYLRLVWDTELVRRQIEAAARTTAGIYKVNQQDLKRIRLPLPPLDEQSEVVASLAYQYSGIDELKRALDKATVRAKRLRAAVLRSAFEGRLAAREWLESGVS